MVFSEKAGRLFEHREAGEFLPAPKKAFARGQPRLWRGRPVAKLQGDVSFGTFLCAKEKYMDKQMMAS